MKVLLLGASGFIGSEIARQLQKAGHQVTGVGRSRHAPLSSAAAQWLRADLNHLSALADWLPYLEGIDAVVNASGALQTGAKDRLDRSQARAIIALVEACEGSDIRRFIQISAPGAHQDAATDFMRTKAAADERLKQSGLRWTILRPGLVIGRNAYGGTALIRALAAFPFLVPLVRPSGYVQTVSLEELGRIVTECLSGTALHCDADLVEARPHSLRELVLLHRQWLGMREPAAVIELPIDMARPIGWMADGLGWLGWRPPLRSTALKVMQADVTGAPDHAIEIFGARLSSLTETLAGLPSGQQDRWQARLFLLLPFIVASLAILFVGSGLIGLARVGAAAGLLVGGGMDESAAHAVVLAGSATDLLLGCAILFRRFARPVSLGMAALTLAYMIGAVIVRGDLWLDPLGPMLKAVPVMILALVAWAILEER